MRSEGKCPRCGKPCLPFSTCYEHRLYTNVHHALRRLKKLGSLIQTDDGYQLVSDFTGRHYKKGKNDRRNLPRIGHKPMDDSTFIEEVLEKAQKLMTEKQIVEAIIGLKLKRQKHEPNQEDGH